MVVETKNRAETEGALIYIDQVDTNTTRSNGNSVFTDVLMLQSIKHTLCFESNSNKKTMNMRV